VSATLYQFEVTHPELGTVVVDSIGPESATAAAATRWGVPWREVAGYCWAKKLGKAQKPRCRRCLKEFGAAGEATAYCPDCLRLMEWERQRKRQFKEPDRRAGMRQ